MKPSPEAARFLLDAAENGMTMFDFDADQAQGATDCPEGCVVEPDGHCRHGWLSAEETMFRMVG
jgi:hypothetical protein